MNSNELRLLFELAQNKGCKFTTLVYRSAESGELARHTLLFGVDYKTAIERDLKFLRRLKKIIGNKKYGTPGAVLDFQAVEELIASLEKSLVKHSSPTQDDTDKDVYDYIFPGVKQHKDTGAYYLWALGVKKDVIEPGTKGSKKTVNSKPLTVAKDRIRTKLRTNQYRQFRLSNVGKATFNGNTLVLE
jgi:hypothetical protein